MLSRRIAARNFYPAVSVLESVSRVMPSIVSREHMEAAGRIRDLLATYAESEDLINIGAYKAGSNLRVDWALEHLESVRGFLSQRVEERSSFEETDRLMLALAPRPDPSVQPRQEAQKEEAPRRSGARFASPASPSVSHED